LVRGPRRDRLGPRGASRGEGPHRGQGLLDAGRRRGSPDRKSTRLNSSHGSISYAVFCLKKKTAVEGVAYIGIAICTVLLTHTLICLETDSPGCRSTSVFVQLTSLPSTSYS